MTVIRRAGLDPNAAYMPNAIALVKNHLARHANLSARLVPNRSLVMAAYRESESTPAEVWSVIERYVRAQGWSNVDDVLAECRKRITLRIGGRSVTIEEAQQMLTAESPYAGG